MTHYQTLGVGSAATAEDIKSAWRRASAKWHPDVCQEPDAAAKFRAAAEAYEVLGDPDRRRRYDVEQLRSVAAAPEVEDTAELLARRHLGRDLSARERTGVRWLSFAARMAGRR